MAPRGARLLSRAATLTASPRTWNSRITRPRTSPPTTGPVLIPTTRSSGSARPRTYSRTGPAHAARGGGGGGGGLGGGGGHPEARRGRAPRVLAAGAAVPRGPAVEELQRAAHRQVCRPRTRRFGEIGEAQ